MIFLEGGINIPAGYILVFFLSPPIFLITGLIIRKKKKELAVLCYILAFLVPLISFGLCLG